ncbi:unnamed protein product [Lepeophtheirus salmonis]|uniref:(salmon louse) hypothetical protein n=1 Tax=Lepeophtheirus salmonis TaxID=72036 RepID=A0A7R8CFP7_LEPSM|nr:unnamed protein product [Lepeophtheirus salmonis]CAF2752723.1 unnamed protein product [Lepeophtheirus salmonis]
MNQNKRSKAATSINSEENDVKIVLEKVVQEVKEKESFYAQLVEVTEHINGEGQDLMEKKKIIGKRNGIFWNDQKSQEAAGGVIGPDGCSGSNPQLPQPSLDSVNNRDVPRVMNTKFPATVVVFGAVSSLLSAKGCGCGSRTRFRPTKLSGRQNG